MSVSQMKKAVFALRSYLGKDAKGAELLDDIAREVHEVRTYSAKIANELEASRQREVTLRGELEQLSKKNKQHEETERRLRDKANQLDSRNKILESKHDDVMEKQSVGEKFSINDGDAIQLTRMVERVRKYSGGALDKPQEVVSHRGAKWVSYDVLQLAGASGDHEGFANLGRIVFLAAITLPYKIAFDSVVKICDLPKSKKHGIWDKYLRASMRFFGHSFESRSKYDLYRENLNKNKMKDDECTSSIIFGDQ